jgi:hypothetical protein
MSGGRVYTLGKPAKPGVDPKVKARYMLAQAKRMERLMKRLAVKVEIVSLDDVKAFVNRLIQLQAEKRLEPHEMRTLIKQGSMGVRICAT